MAQTYQITVSRGGGTHLCHASSMAVALKRLLDSGMSRSDGGPATTGRPLVQLERIASSQSVGPGAD